MRRVKHDIFRHFFFYFAGQTELIKLFKQAMNVTTFDQLGISLFCPKQEIIDVITKLKEANEL